MKRVLLAEVVDGVLETGFTRTLKCWVSLAACGWLAFASPALSQCQTAEFRSVAGTDLLQQGFRSESAEIPSMTPAGQGQIGLRWVSSAGGEAVLSPPDWSGPTGPGTRQIVRARLRVNACPAVLTPQGARDSGFSIYRGICVQGGRVVAGVADGMIFLSIRDASGAEVCRDEAAFDARAATAVYVFMADDAGMTFRAYEDSGGGIDITARNGGATCTAGRYSGNAESWRMGDGSTAAGSDVVLYDWEMGTTLAPEAWDPAPLTWACPGGSVEARVGAASGEPREHQWQAFDATPQEGWRNLESGPLMVSGVEVGTVVDPMAPAMTLDGLRLSRLRGVGLAASIRLRCVTINPCGEAISGEAEIRECTADFNCSGAVSVQDVFDFLEAYFAGSPGADVNGSGPVTVQDIFDFLEAYFAGCAA